MAVTSTGDGERTAALLRAIWKPGDPGGEIKLKSD